MARHKHFHFKLLDHSHTNKKRDNEHSSWEALIIILLVLGGFLIFAARTFSASEDLTVRAKVPAEISDSAPVITDPLTETVFFENNVLVQGTCDSSYIVQLYSNGNFIGSTACISGKFQLNIELSFGKNSLIARHANILGEAGPKSNTVVLYFRLQPEQENKGGPIDRLYEPQPIDVFSVFSKETYIGGPYDSDIIWKIIITGGTAPYALDIDWGDGENTLLSVATAGETEASHMFTQTGIYSGIVSGVDAEGRTRRVEMALVVRGEPTSGTLTANERVLEISWPAYLLSSTIVMTFITGEHFELWQLRRKKCLVDPKHL